MNATAAGMTKSPVNALKEDRPPSESSGSTRGADQQYVSFARIFDVPRIQVIPEQKASGHLQPEPELHSLPFLSQAEILPT